MNQNIHEANQKKLKQQRTAGVLLAAVGLLIFIVALLMNPGSFTPLMLLGLVLVVVGIAVFLINHKKGIAYAKYLEQEASRPKSAAEKLAEQQAEAVAEQELHKEAQDIASARKSHMGLGMLGAVIGCLAGAVVWSYIMGQGYISVYGGIIMILLSFGGYKLFSWNMGTDGMSASVGMSVIMLPIATYGGFIWFFNNNARIIPHYRSLLFAEKWQQTWGILREYELMGEFFKCLGNGYLFMIVAAVAVYAFLKRFEK